MAEIRINTTGGLKLYDADNSHYAQIVAGTITSNVDAITLGHNLATFNAAVTATGILKTDDTTEATSTTDGSLQTDGGLSVAKDAIIGDDLKLLSDSAVLSLGAGSDITFTHDGTTGLTIAATPISIDSTGELHLNSTTGDIKLQDGGTDQIAFDLDGTSGEVIMKPAVDSDDLVISQYDGTEVIRIEDNASLGLVGNKLSIANSSSDVVIKPLTDAKDIIFQQYDGTEVARIEDNATFNVSSAGKFAYAGTAVTATAAEMNLLDGGTSVGSSITLADADGFIVNDGGTMKTIPASDISSYAGGNLVLLGRSVNDDSGTSGGIQFNSIFTSTYRNYLLLIGKVAVETNQADLQVRLLDASNNSLTGNHYTRGGEYNDAGNNSVDEIQAIGTSSWIIGPSSHNADSTPTHATFHIFNNSHTTTNDRVFMTGTGIWHHEAQHDPRIFYFGGSYANAVHAAGIRVETSSGNISDHEISIFGIKAY